jgi:hypothetical protein
MRSHAALRTPVFQMLHVLRCVRCVLTARDPVTLQLQRLQLAVQLRRWLRAYRR